MKHFHEASCACCNGLIPIFDRRRFVRALAVGGATLAFTPHLLLAAEGNYEAMVLACIDPRMHEPVHKYTVEQNLTGKFSQFVIAGAAIGVVAPAFKDWHKPFGTISPPRSSCTASRRSSRSITAIAGLPRSRMAKPKSQTRKWKPKRTGRRSRNSASKLESGTRSSA